jgi:hypothetical protein
MRPVLLAAVLATGALLLHPAPATHAQISTYECQQQFRQMAGPIMDRIFWYVSVQDAIPTSPIGRPYLSPGPIGAYPGFQGFVAGPGGPGWALTNAYGGINLAQFGLTNAMTGGALSVPAVTQAFINATPGGVPNLGTANLATLAPLQQGLAGNALAAISTREAMIGNRLAAAGLWTTLTSYPMAQAANYQDIISAIQTWIESTCPAASPGSDNSPAAPARPRSSDPGD